MFEKEEEKLAEFKKTYDNISIPIEAIDNAIMTGYRKASKKRTKKTGLIVCAAAIIFLSGFFTTIRLSPTFAGYVTIIPGMEKIVNLIVDNKGFLSAVENEYYQEIGVFGEKNGIKMIIDGVIADENGMVIFYTLSNKDKYLRMKDFELKSMDGTDISLFTSGFSPPEAAQEVSGTIEYFFQEPLITKKFELFAEVNGEEFHLPFSIKEEMKKVKTIELNKTVTIEGEKLTIEHAKIYPLRVAVRVKMDQENTKKLLSFDDIRLVDEVGETWNTMNGINASKISDDEHILYLQSNYFREPKKLYLAFDRIQAVDKDEATVIVDVEKQEILKQPKGNKLVDFTIDGNYLVFRLETEEDALGSASFSTIKDADGKELSSSSSYYREEGDRMRIIGVEVEELNEQKGPISLEIAYFPAWIEGSVKIKIK